METTHSQGKDINVNLKGVTICCDDFGTGNIPIIFIHGFPFDKSSWEPQLEFLKHTHRVLAYDIRGFGKSTAGEENMSISLFADDLVELMNVLQIEKAVACGLSMGGYILLNAVSRYPDRFEAIILSDTQCIADSAEVMEKRYKTIDQINADGVTDFANAFVKNVFCPDSLNTKKELVEKIRNIILTTLPITITGTLNALAQRSEMCSSLNEILIPVLILCGEEDTVTPMAQAEFLNLNILNSEFCSIAKAGHLSNLEQPDEFNRYLTPFITKW
ncbi:MAG: alpha/beta fold hydrolase [Mariniphaga sp.]|nr:alpha/beta fold hydrolase [Mariniphaga sp.]